MWHTPFKTVLIIALTCSLHTFAQEPISVDEKNTAPPQALLPLEDLRTFTRIYNHIRTSYVEELSDEELLTYAIKGMIEELDPHSAYLDPENFEDLQTHTTGEFGGLGIEIGMENGFVKVISPIDDTPAQKAGIEAGDLIIRLDDEPVKGMSLNEAIKIMRGEVGSPLRLTIAREGVDQPIEMTIVRDTIQTKSVRTKILDSDYLYIRIAQFQVDTGKDLATKVAKDLQENDAIKGIVLDLRNNPGGVLQASVDVAGVFLDGGLVVYTDGRLKSSKKNYNAIPGDISHELPLVTLINGGSASASEIVAGALQDHGRAIIIGTRSFGKGSVQTVVPISNDRAIKITTARYFTPNGRSIQAKGIDPDVIVERAKVTTIQPQFSVTEADLSGHLNNNTGVEESNTKARKKTRKKEKSLQQKDNQLHEALNLLKGLHIFKNQKKVLNKSHSTAELPKNQGLTL